jgi:hypothetical protein
MAHTLGTPQATFLGGVYWCPACAWRSAHAAPPADAAPALRGAPGPKPGSFQAGWQEDADQAIAELRDHGSLSKAAAVIGRSSRTLRRYIARRDPAFFQTWQDRAGQGGT